MRSQHFPFALPALLLLAFPVAEFPSEVGLTPQWREFSFDVTAAQSSGSARVTFSRLAPQPDDYRFADVSLTLPK